jgi:hypothetical protein
VPVGVNHGQVELLGDADGHPSPLPVDLAAILDLERGPAEDQRREREIETPLLEVNIVLARVPGEHHRIYDCIYRHKSAYVATARLERGEGERALPWRGGPTKRGEKENEMAGGGRANLRISGFNR